MQSDGVVHDIHYGDVLIKFGSILDMEDEEVPYIAIGKEGKASAQLQDGDIVIADTAEDETAGKVVEIYNAQRKRIEAGLHTIPCRPISAYAPMYLGYYMNSMFYHSQLLSLLQGVKVLSISKANISKTVITSPQSKTEQEKISSFLYLIDLKVKKQRQVIDTLKKYKRGVFEAIFSRTLRLMPRTSQSEWTAFKLSDFATRITRKNNGATDIPLTISAQYGLIDQRDFFSKVVASTDMSGYYLLHRGEYAYNRSTSNDYPFGSIKRLDLYDKGAVSTLYLCFAIKEEVVLSDFAKWYFESSQWYRGVNEICAEGARNHGLLNVPTDGFFNTVHILPSDIEEQSRIAAFLSRIHEKVIQAQEELDELNSLRKGLMQQLFI